MFHDATARSICEDNQDKFILGHVGSSLFETSWKLRGFENALIDCIQNPSFYEELLDHILELQFAMVDKVCELPVDAVFLGDDFTGRRGRRTTRK